MKDEGQTAPLQARDRLWQLLLEAEILSPAAAEELKQRIIGARPPLGKILCEERFVTVSHIMRLLEIQAEQSHLRIGELAVKHGYCSEVEVDIALRIQRQSTLHPVELLLEDKNIDQTKLGQAALKYIRFLEDLSQ